MSRADQRARQIALPLQWNREDERLVVTPALENALAPLLDPGTWSATGAILTGPARSGKSLIGQWIAQKCDADIADDADRTDEEALFHRWNRAREAQRPFLMLAASAPGEWALSLPDLKSRVASALLVEMPPPDEQLMRALLTLHLAGHGATISDECADYAVQRIERSHAAAEDFAETLNMLSMVEKKPITHSLVRSAWDRSADRSADHLTTGGKAP